MARNMGSADRIIRALAGIALIVLGIVFRGGFWAAFAAGVVLLGTSTISFCPIYAIFGWKTTGRAAAQGAD